MGKVWEMKVFASQICLFFASITASHGINVQKDAFAAFKQTQAYVYYGDNATGVDSWGDWIHMLGNSGKHTKVSKHSRTEDLSKAMHGTFRKTNLTIQIENASSDVYSWSFRHCLTDRAMDVDVGVQLSINARSRLLYKALFDKEWIHKKQLYWSHGDNDRKKPLAAIVDLVQCAVLDQGERREGLLLAFVGQMRSVINENLASDIELKRVAEFLEDKALVAAFVRSESHHTSTLGGLAERALRDTRSWVDAIVAVVAGTTGAATSTGLAVPVCVPAAAHAPTGELSSLTIDAELTGIRRWELTPGTVDAALNAFKHQWCAQQLLTQHNTMTNSCAGDVAMMQKLYLECDMESEYERLRMCSMHYAETFPRWVCAVTSDRGALKDQFCQLEFCRKWLWAAECWTPEDTLRHSVKESQVAQLLIVLRHFIEQIVSRFANTCLHAPNGQYLSLTFSLLQRASRDNFMTHLSDNCFLPVGAVDGVVSTLDNHFPKVLAALEDMQPYTNGHPDDNWVDDLVYLSNKFKHERVCCLFYDAQGVLFIRHPMTELYTRCFEKCFSSQTDWTAHQCFDASLLINDYARSNGKESLMRDELWTLVRESAKDTTLVMLPVWETSNLPKLKEFVKRNLIEVSKKLNNDIAMSKNTHEKVCAVFLSTFASSCMVCHPSPSTERLCQPLLLHEDYPLCKLLRASVLGADGLLTAVHESQAEMAALHKAAAQVSCEADVNALQSLCTHGPLGRMNARRQSAYHFAAHALGALPDREVRAQAWTLMKKQDANAWEKACTVKDCVNDRTPDEAFTAAGGGGAAGAGAN